MGLQFIIKTINSSTVKAMFRITRVLQTVKPSMFTANPLFKPTSLFFTNIHLFSEASKNKVYEIIEDEKVMKNLNTLAQQIRNLEEAEKLQVYGVLLQKIVGGQLPTKIMQNQNINEQIKKHPEPYFDINYHRIQQGIEELGEQLEGKDHRAKKILAKQISDAFIICFDTLKKMEARNASPRELQLLRTFAHYNFRYLSQLVEPLKNKEVINKSKECYKLILSKITNLLKSFQQDEVKLKHEATLDNPEEKQKEIDYEFKYLEQTRIMLIDEYSEVVDEMMTIEQQLSQQRQQKMKESKNRTVQSQDDSLQFQFQYCKQVLVLEPYIAKAVKNYEVIPHIYLQSQNLYKLKKRLVQVRNEKQVRDVLASRKSQEEKQAALKQLQQKFKNDYEQLYQEGVNALRDTQKQQKLSEEYLSEFIMSMFTTRIHKFAEMTASNNKNALLKAFGEQIQKLVNNISNQVQRKKVLVLIVKEIKDKLGVKIDSYVQKMPRNMRTQRRG